MDPNTGEIKAMANYPDYDLNDPQNPIYTGLGDSWDSLSDSEKADARYGLWNNKNVSSLYEPGSTFKTLITSIALEEGITDTDIAGDFYCKGYQELPNAQEGEQDKIYCWAPNPHYGQSLREALEHSCNPSFMQLGQRIGIRTMYKYFKAYGLFDKTGTDIAATPASIFTQLEKVGIAELYTTSFGQRFSITPLQLITAVSAIANGGTLVEPKIVGKIENTDTGSITAVDTKEVRQVISEETANKVKDLMHSVVEEGTGGRAKVAGYEIGGKSGTSEPRRGHEEDGYIASFIALSPIENTQIVALVILYNPKSVTNGYQGGTICAPVVGQILSEVLPYLNVNGSGISATSNNGPIQTNSKTVINSTGMTVASAREKLEATGFKVVSKAEDESSSIVTDQMPKAGAYLEAGATIYLYTSSDEVRTSVTIPDVENKTLEDAKSALKALNLNVIVDGSAGKVISQSISAGTQVEEGSVVTIVVSKNSSGGQ